MISVSVAKYISMEDDEWFEKYKPRTNEFGELISYETYGEEYKEVCKVNEENPNLIWTQVDGESSDRPIIVSGLRWVNRINYYICDVPFEDDDSIEVIDDSDYE